MTSAVKLIGWQNSTADWLLNATSGTLLLVRNPALLLADFDPCLMRNSTRWKVM